MTTLYDYPPTVTIIEIGPGMPGDTSNYVGGEVPYYTWDPARDTSTGNTNTGGTTTSPGPTYSSEGSVIYPPGTDPRSPTDVGDGTIATLPASLDVVIREGIKFAGGESQADQVDPSIIDQSGTGVQWDNVQGLISGNEVTSVSLTNGQTSNYLEFSVFDLDIPEGAIVTGITVTFNRQVLSGSVTETLEVYRCAVQE